jgi:hypothetical protein
MKQNITLSMEKDLIRKAKILAAKREISISKLLSRELARILSDDGLYESARKRATAGSKRDFT